MFRFGPQVAAHMKKGEPIMARSWFVPVSVILGLIISACLTGLESSYGQNPYDANNQSALLDQNSTGAFGRNQVPAYYPDWYNYLDRLQQRGGYYSVTGNYPNSPPVTSYYPSNAIQQQQQYVDPRAQQSNQANGM